MISRRGFIGSVIGAFMAQDFFARLETEPFQFEEVKKYPYRLLFREANYDKVIQATPIVDIVPYNDGLQKGWRFVAGHFDCTQILTVRGAILVDERGRVIGENKFACDVCTISGDQLNVTYSLSADHGLGVQTADELAAMYLEPRLKIRNNYNVSKTEAQEFLEDYRRKHG